MKSLSDVSDEVFIETYKYAKQDNLGQEFMALTEEELTKRNLL